MLGKQSGLDGGEHTYLDHVGRDSFYGFLALHRRELFRDEDFTELYCSDNGRPSVPPSLLATALLLQIYEGVSDEEAKARADFDLRWKVALGIGLQQRPFAKSTLQLFRARLVLHEQVRAVFQQSLSVPPGYSRRTGPPTFERVMQCSGLEGSTRISLSVQRSRAKCGPAQHTTRRLGPSSTMRPGLGRGR